MNRTVTKSTTLDNLRLRLFADGYERLLDKVADIKRAALAGKLEWTVRGLRAGSIEARPYERTRNALIVKAVGTGTATDAARWAAKRAGVKAVWPIPAH